VCLSVPAAAMEPFLAKWKLESSDNFDDYMKAVGIGLATRKIAGSQKPVHVFIAEPDGSYILRAESAFKNVDVKFRLGEEFDETTADGRKAKTVIRMEGAKMIQDQKADVHSLITREITDPNTMLCTFVAGGVTSTRTFKKQ